MNRKIKVLICCILISQLFLMTVYAKPDWPSDTAIQAESGIVIDGDSGAVLFGQDIHTPYPPASITKILTALIVLENAKLDDMVTFSKDSVYNVEEGSGNKLNVDVGDKLSVEDCLYSMILHSCNQAANALAEHVGGSKEGFVRMMNEKIKELGCTESHFVNPSGLNADDQYVTAYDMALIAKAAYSNKKLVEIGSAISHNIPPTSRNPEGLTIYNEHRLVKTKDPKSEFYCPTAVAGKTGYLVKAGNTLVTYGKQDERRVISVILKGSPRQYFIDGKNLLEFGLSRFENVPVKGNETGYTSGQDPIQINGTSYKPSDLELEPGGVITLPKGAEFSQADKTLVTELPEGSPKGAVAMIQYLYNDRKVGQVYLMEKKDTQQTSQESGQGTTEGKSEESKTDLGSDKASSGKKGKGALAAVGIAALLGMAGGGTGFYFYRKKKELKEMALRRKERRQRLKSEGAEDAFKQILNQRRKRNGKNKKKGK